ncbi:MAG: NUDIX domain-containing protein [Oscillospiraceae bacterium]|nr:NUDIX domain-containing protein [Oscillospiraceae bacterium]
MIYEKSCGAVVFSRSGEGVLYLIEDMQKGHISICKGHVEPDDIDEYDTARREIMEETSLSVRFLDGFREVIRYSPYDGCEKDVVFFLAETDSVDTVPQECEVAHLRWLPLEKALDALTYESDRSVLLAAAHALGEA